MKKLLSLIFALFLLLSTALAQDAYQIAINEGTKALNAQQYDKAISQFDFAIQNAKSLNDKNKENYAKSLKTRAIYLRDRLEVSPQEITFPNLGGVDTVLVSAGELHKVTSSSAAAWCTLDKSKPGVLILRAEANPDKQPREGYVYVKKGKTKTVSVKLTQEAREETRKVVHFTSNPKNAHVLLTGDEYIATPNDREFESGTYSLLVTKDGYKSSKVRFTVEDDNIRDTVRVHVDLQPTFASLRLKVLPEKGFSFGREQVHVLLNNMSINLSAPTSLSYDADYKGMPMYQVYSDGAIPVSDSDLAISVNVAGFERKDTTFKANAGQEYNVCLRMKPRLGSLTLRDLSNASDAEVYMVDADTTFIGTLGTISRLPIIVGAHKLYIRKPGYLSKEDYSFVTDQGRENVLEVSMERYGTYRFETDPPEAELMIDDKLVDHTPSKPYVFRETEQDANHNIELSKEGFLTIRDKFTPEYLGEEIIVKNYSFKKEYPIRVTTDRDKNESLYLTLKTSKKADDKSDSTLVRRLSLPIEVSIPKRAEPYYVEIVRWQSNSSPKIAYRGKLKFHDEGKNVFYYPIWSQYNFHFLEANLTFLGAASMSLGVDAPAEDPDIPAIGMKPYKLLGKVSLADFSLFNGFTSSAARASFFHGTGAIAIPNSADTAILRDTEHTNYLPAISFLLINDTFRLGGTLFNYLDLNAVASYAWYPGFYKQFLSFSFVSGHDIFAGIEIGSRIPYFNATLRMGLQMYKGMKANIYNSKYNPNASNTSSPSEQYYIQDFTVPDMFTMGLIISLGGHEAKGNSLLRVF